MADVFSTPHKQDNGDFEAGTLVQRASQHGVQFYESDTELCGVVAAYIAAGLRLHEPVIVVATQAHSAAFVHALRAQGAQPDSAIATGQLLLVDADTMLSRFMVDGMPDWELFRDAAAALIERVRPQGSTRVRAYGEMVDQLWRNGNPKAAIRLEELWCDLQRLHGFSLLCAYVMANFYKESAGLQAVCDAHDHVATAQLGPEFKPGHAHALAAEIAQRKQVEVVLRDSLHELRRAQGELYRSQEQLRNRERQLQIITDTLPVLVGYVDVDQRYRSVNVFYEQWFGRPRGELLGLHVRDVLGDDSYARVRPHIDAALRGRAGHFAGVFRTDDGEREIEARYWPHLDPEGLALGYVELIADVSEPKRAERARDAVAERTARLTKITAAMADAVTPDQVYEAVVDEVAAALEASSVALWIVREDGRSLTLARSVGYATEQEHRFGSVAVDDPKRFPAIDVVRDHHPIWMDSQAELLERYPELATVVTSGRTYRIACLPVIARGRTLGALALTFDSERPLDDDQRAFLLLIARYSAQGLERLRLLEAERRSRAAAEASAARMRLLSQASRTFSETGLDLSALLQTIAEQVTGEHAHACAVGLVDGERVELAAIHHRDPQAVAFVRSLVQPYALKVGEGMLGRAIATGESLLIADADQELLIAAAPPHWHDFIRRYLPSSVIVAPLRTQGQVIGALCALRAEGSPPFGEDDLAFMQDLAERAAMAIQSSRLQLDNQQARERAELLYRLAAAVIRADSAEQVMEAALDAIGKALGAERSAVLAFDAEGVMRFKAHRGLSDEYRAAVEGHSPWSRDVVSPSPVIVSDVMIDDSLASFRPLFERERIGALCFIPLVASARLIGKFMVYYDQPRQLSAAELEMANAIASHVGAALHRFGAMAELERSVRFNEMFTGILGHDLRNPLGAIMMAANLVLMRDDSELTRPLLRIMTSGARMARMIDQLLDFTRVRVGAGIPLAAARTDAVSVLRQAMDELDDAHPDFRLTLEQTGDTFGTWDSDRLLQVFSNLVANALQHGIAEHGVQVTVDGTAAAHVVIAVHNMGAVPPELLSKVFDPMTGGQRRQPKSQGLGLGLHISREIVRAHGGRIAVRSSVGEGTTFSVELPRHKLALKECASQ